MTTFSSPSSPPEVQSTEKPHRPNRWWRFFRWWFRHWKFSLSLLTLLGIGATYFWLKHSLTTDTSLLTIEHTSAIESTPEEVRRLRDIGEWEFLAVSTEEMTELHRTGILHDDHLVCIYRGTLRLGINLRHVSDNWFRADNTTAFLQLPPIELLDEDFIDETRTTTFFEEGSWSASDKQKLYQQAQKAMKQRTLTPEHLQQAQQNAKEQFSKIFSNLGYHEVIITFAKSSSTATH